MLIKQKPNMTSDIFVVSVGDQIQALKYYSDLLFIFLSEENAQ